MVTGKNKERFEKWYDIYDENYIDFYYLQPEMQKGVYEAYYDSFGIRTTTYFSNEIKWCFEVSCKDNHNHLGGYDTRQEAFAEALKEANKLSNEQLTKADTAN